MDTSKFKSVTISIDTWNRLHKIAAKDMRSVSRTIEYLVHEHNYLNKKYGKNGDIDITPKEYFKEERNG
tara:strand:+ start:246 stop:452 length:207 start_codon:yes stop_codon:yes gene_type:complete